MASFQPGKLRSSFLIAQSPPEFTQEPLKTKKTSSRFLPLRVFLGPWLAVMPTAWKTPQCQMPHAPADNKKIAAMVVFFKQNCLGTTATGRRRPLFGSARPGMEITTLSKDNMRSKLYGVPSTQSPTASDPGASYFTSISCK